MKIATYNVNGVNGRLPNLLAWLKAPAPDVVGAVVAAALTLLYLAQH
jgi:hypothetical protein